MEVSKIIENILDCENADRKKIIKILSKGIELKCDEKEVCETLYRECYGDTLIPEMCEELISKMNNIERSGSIWTIEDTNNVAKKLDIIFEAKPYTPEEFRAAMTMEYYEHNIPLKKSGVSLEPTGWGRMADYTLTKCPSKLVDYYFC